MKDEEQDATKELALAVLFLVLMQPASLLPAYIAYDVARLFEIPFLKDFSFVNWYGLLVIVAMVRIKKSPKSSFGDKFYDLFLVIIALLIAWGLSYIMHMIIT